LTEAPRFAVAAIDLFERDVRLRLPFRFGAATVRHAPQAFVRATIRDAAGRTATGWTAEMMIPKWFDKRPERSHDENIDDLRAALILARDAYTSEGTMRTAFGQAAHHYRPLMSVGTARDLNPLVMSYGTALTDRAILDALCRLRGASFHAAVRTNLFALDASLAPDLETVDLGPFLASREMPASIAARHTVGLGDPLDNGEVVDDPDDGLPIALDQVIARYGHRHFKVKLSGIVDDDLERLTRIAATLGELHGYAVTLDGNEQFTDVESIHTLWRAMRGRRALARFVASVLYLEQPLPRQATLTTDVHALAHDVRLLIDEADESYDAFRHAQRRGYSGVSSKNCKGPYKSFINAVRCAGSPTRRLFVSGEDLTTQCGLAVQQDLALAGVLGITHVERNGHHYVAGFAGQGADAHEQAAFAAAHPSLYTEGPGGTRLAIRGGRIALDSLDVPGFASAALPDPSALSPMRVPTPHPARPKGELHRGAQHGGNQ
jgi:hypothetical protein